MEKQKTLTLLCGLFMFCMKVSAQQLNAQNDLFSVQAGSCSYYLNVTVNDNAGTTSVNLQILTQAQNGVAGVNGGFLTYCPTGGFLGADFFTYVVSDSTGADSATVYINVVPYNNFIFAGDADQNGRVENFDVLAIGLAYNLSGPSRADSVSVNALAWSPSSYINSNPGAADCNGDGIVDANDLPTIEAFYHDTFPYPPAFDIETSTCRNNGIPFYVESLSGDSVYDGDTLDVLIKLGDSFLPTEAYGIAFALEFDKGFVNADAAEIFTNSSWLYQSDAGLFFKRNFQSAGAMEFALSKTNHNSATGGGQLLRARLPIDDNIDGIVSAPGWHNLNLKLTKTRVVSEYNVLRDVCVQQPSIMVYKIAAGISNPESKAVKVYPNPTNNQLFIEAENIHEIEITDITGRRIFQQKENSISRVELYLNDFSLATGTYFVKIKTADFVSTQKIFVQH